MSKFMPLNTLFEPIGFCRDGSPIWLFQGGAPEDDNGNDGDGDNDGKGNDSNQGDGSDGNKESGGSEGDSDDEEDDDDDDSSELPDEVKAILRKERQKAKDAVRAQRKAEAERKAAEEKVQQFEDKDKSELQRAQEEAQREKKRADENAAKAKAADLRIAFLQDTSVTWVDAADALDFAMRKYGLSDLEIDDDGRVDKKAVKAIVKKLADEKKYLVASGDDKDSGKGASGGSFNGGKAPKDGPDRKALTNKYPSMQGRRRTAG